MTFAHIDSLYRNYFQEILKIILLEYIHKQSPEIVDTTKCTYSSVKYALI